jgi:hypothetical protein
MQKLIVFLILSLFICSVKAQKHHKSKQNSKQEFRIDSSKVKTLHKTVKALYEVISAEKKESRNWKQFKFLFYPGAKIIPSGFNTEEGVYKAKFLTPDEYIKNSDKWLKINGFIENEIYRNVNTFGNIAHVFTTFQCFHSKTDPKPFMRGINSIQLINDGKRWWILNLYWAQETKQHPIPKAYLPRKK